MKHDHVGPWWAIGAGLVVLFIWCYVTVWVHEIQFSVIYDRVGEMQRQIDCWPDGTLVSDHDGNEFCIQPTVESRDGH